MNKVFLNANFKLMLNEIIFQNFYFIKLNIFLQVHFIHF